MSPKIEKCVLVYALICIIAFLLLLMAPIVFSMTCENTRTACVEGGGTQTIEGVEVALDCWKFETKQTCHADTSDTCSAVHAQGCQPVDATCIESVNGTCLAQQETVACALNTCDLNENKAGQAEIFCEENGAAGCKQYAV